MRFFRRRWGFPLIGIAAATLVLASVVSSRAPSPGANGDFPSQQGRNERAAGAGENGTTGTSLVAALPDASAGSATQSPGLGDPATSTTAPAPGGTAGTTAPNPMQAWVTLSSGTVSSLIASPAPGAFAVTTTTAGPTDVWTASGRSGAGWTAAEPGRVYKAGVSVRAVTAARTAATYLVFYDQNAQKLQAVWGQAIVDGTSWTSMPLVAGIAPAGARWVMYGVVFHGTARSETHQIASAHISDVAGSSPAIVGPLHVSGASIVDARGARVVLRGLNRVGFETNRKAFPRDPEIAQAKSWGANIVRVPLAESLWLNTCTADAPTNDPLYAAKVDAVVHSITSRGMVALLDLHRSVTQSCGASDLQPMADAGFAVTFWKQLASRYKGNPLVAFDLYNEPHSISAAVWLNGGSITSDGTTYSAAGMQSMYNAVRGQGADNLVFATGLSFGSRAPRYPLKGTDVVYAIHDYTCASAPPPSCTVSDPNDAGLILSNWTTFASSHAVAITEFGWPSKTSGAFNAKVIALAERLRWGWIAFAWDGGTNGMFSLLGSMGPAYEPSQAGIPVLIGLTRN